MGVAVVVRWVGLALVCAGCGPLIVFQGEGDAEAEAGGDVSTSEGSTSSEASTSEESTGSPFPETTGALRWLRLLDGGGDDFGHYVAIDREGSVALSGVRGDPELGLLPFVAALDRDGNTSWELDLAFGRDSDGGVTMESVATAHVIVYGESAPFLLGVTQGEVTEFVPGGTSGGAHGFATIGRFADGAHAVGLRGGLGEPWIERWDESVLAWSVGVDGNAEGQVSFLTPLEDDMLALVQNYELGVHRLLRISGSGAIEWSIEIPCAGTVAASTLGITVASGPDGELCRVSTDGVIAADPFAIHLPTPPGAVGMAPDGDLLALMWSSDDAVITVARVDLEQGLEWSTEVDEGLLPFSIAVAPDGSSAVTGVRVPGGGNYDAFVFVLDP